MTQTARHPPRKIVLIGAIGVGKTSLVRRLVHREFHSEYLATVGFDIYTYTASGAATGLQHDVNLVIWDSDGELDSGIFDTPIIKGASGAVIIGDVVRRSSQEDMARLAEGCRKHLAGRELVFILNKADLTDGNPPPVPPADLTRFGNKLFWTSAKTGDNVDQTFAAIAKAVDRRGY